MQSLRRRQQYFIFVYFSPIHALTLANSFYAPSFIASRAFLIKLK
jgi:hypothetical protein